MLKHLLLKKIRDFPQFFKIKCHALYCQELLHTLFLKARFGDLHTNFPIKSLSKGKNSCHADRQLTKQFYCFFRGREWEKQGKASSQYTTHTASKHCCNNLNFCRSKFLFYHQNQVIKQKFGLILRTSPVAWRNVWSSMKWVTVKCHSGDIPHRGTTSTLNWAFLFAEIGETPFFWIITLPYCALGYFIPGHS